MTFIDPDSEGALETSTIRLFESLRWEAANCYHEICGENSTLGRQDFLGVGRQQHGVAAGAVNARQLQASVLRKHVDVGRPPGAVEPTCDEAAGAGRGSRGLRFALTGALLFHQLHP